MLRKLALLVAVAALGLSLAGAANAKNPHPPNGTVNSHGLNFSDGT